MTDVDIITNFIMEYHFLIIAIAESWLKNTDTQIDIPASFLLRLKALESFLYTKA